MSNEPTLAIRRAMDHDDRISLHPGTLIDGKWHVDRVLGVGGMGTVLAARSLETGELVALKFMLAQCAEHRQLMVRFQREAHATERLKSEHVGRVLSSGTAQGGAPYIVMEYLDGEDLRSLVKREGPLEPRIAATYVSQACIAMGEAHALGIVHRDLKPANLFLARRPGGPSIVKVLDFGVAKFDSPNVAGDELEVTSTEGVLGSRHYMAPEQITRPASVNALADVWALGAILHYLLTGTTPFGAPTAEEVIVNVLREPPHSIEALRPGVSPRLCAIVEHCLQKDPEARYPNVTQLARALAPFLRCQDGEEPSQNVPVPKEFSRTMPLEPLDVAMRLAAEEEAAAKEKAGAGAGALAGRETGEAEGEEVTRVEGLRRASAEPVVRVSERPAGILRGVGRRAVRVLWPLAAVLTGGLLAFAAMRVPPGRGGVVVAAPARGTEADAGAAVAVSWDGVVEGDMPATRVDGVAAPLAPVAPERVTPEAPKVVVRAPREAPGRPQAREVPARTADAGREDTVSPPARWTPPFEMPRERVAHDAGAPAPVKH